MTKRESLKRSHLTRQEIQVLDELIKDGATNKVLADRLFLAEQTIKFHLGGALRYSGCGNRTQLALWWAGVYSGPELAPRPEGGTTGMTGEEAWRAAVSGD